MHVMRSWAMPIAGLIAVVLSGCGGGVEEPKHPEVFPAAGVVTYQDKPVGEAQVTFYSDESTKNEWVCRAFSDASGKFDISTIFSQGTKDVKGLVPGTYTVTVQKMDKMPDPPR